MSSDIYFDFSIQCMKYLITESMFILQRDIINRAQRKDYLSQKPSSSRVLRSVPPSLTLLSVICWVPFWVVSRPFFSTNTRKSPSRDTWSKTVIWYLLPKKGICCPKKVFVAQKISPPCGTSSSWPSGPAAPPSPACSPSSQVPKPSAPQPEKFGPIFLSQ